MKGLGVKYFGTWTDSSGYGEANRMDIHALYVSGLNLTTELLVQMNDRTTYGMSGDIAKNLENRPIEYQIKIIHVTPNEYPNYIEEGKYHIGRLFWETDRLPRAWVRPCNLMQEIWCASEQQAAMITKSGVTVPVYAFPQAINTIKAYEKIVPYSTYQPLNFTFYAIFQWILRKNPLGLIRAYLQEFEGNDNVTLLLKTYGYTYLEDEFNRIKKEIHTTRRLLMQKHYPKIYLCKRLLTSDQMARFHAMGNVFINPSAAEGWGRPMQEAMLYGKPVISPECGGITDVLPSHYYSKIESHETKVKEEAQIPWYTENMMWKELDEQDLAKKMRSNFEDYEDMKQIATKTQQYIIDTYSFQRVGDLMHKRLLQIQSQL